MKYRLSLTALLATTITAVVADTPNLEIADQGRQAAAKIDAATDQTADAVNNLELPEGSGLVAELWAGEPLLANPVAFDFDEQGRLYVAETYRYGTSTLDIRSYMPMLENDMAFRTIEERAAGIEAIFGDDARKLEVESERVRLIQDTDGDGVADQSSEYAAGFNTTLDGIASGVLARKGDVWLTNIPSLWKLGGIDDEGRATSREEILRGFGVHFSFTGHDFHGLAVGPDGKLYFTVGDRGAVVEGPDGARVDLPDTGGVMRANFDGTGLELVHTGLRNPQELAFDELGNLFTGDNDGDMGDRERLVQVVEGGDSGWVIGHQHPPMGNGGVWMSEGWWEDDNEAFPRFALPPLFLLEDGPSGIAYYPGTGLGPDYQGHLFITHFRGNTTTSGVWSYTLESDGASYRLGEKEAFVKNLLPTDVTFGPDGRFYVLDWVDGWPKSNRGRVYAISHPDHAASDEVRQAQAIIAGGMSGREDIELASLLEHPNWNVRLEAQLELASRGADALGLFTAIANDPDAGLHARLHATWGLGILAGHGHEGAETAIAALLAADVAEVRAQAAKLAGDHRVAGQVPRLVDLLRDDDARVKFFAAQSLGKFGDADAAPALLEAARVNNGQDRYLEHAIIMGLAGSAESDTLEAAMTDESAAVRMAVLQVMRRNADARVAAFLDDEDEQIVFAAARAINDVPIADAYADLAAALQGEHAGNDIVALRAINAQLRLGQPGNATALARYAADDANPENLRVEALDQLASWASPFDRDRIMGVYRPLDDRDPAPAREALATVADSLLQSRDTAVLSSTISATAALGVTGINDSLAALVLDDDIDGEARAAALEQLNANDDPRMLELARAAGESAAPELRMAALPIMTERLPDTAATMLREMTLGSVDEQRTAYDTLATTDQPFAAGLLAESLDRLVAGEVPAAAQLELIEAADAHDSTQVAEAMARWEAATATDDDPLAPFSYALEGGDSKAGWKVYWGNSAMPCVRCHVMDPDAEAAGPSLQGIGSRMDRRALLEAVVDPNATIAEGFTSPSSMPDIFDSLLSRAELRDIVETLATMKGDAANEGDGKHGE
ncbi:c-type cytochrome [Marinihelvus fidelis]|uniref:C-type cytochrome n=1 Tax=Marinihelvus fidelis TaxID=2613842 RepID=A0A5N0T8T8_9GAMM|nr:HEAT repeat domain-containing protein [Marinihelvus fidelis]KAA9130894.1 c-type cytochrome [Marinihelvus fidelis]